MTTDTERRLDAIEADLKAAGEGLDEALRRIGDEYPPVRLAGSNTYWGAYEIGEALDHAFPHQDADEFAYGCAHNTWGPLEDGGLGIAGLLMVQQGGNDESDWIWLVRLTDDTHWWVICGCDFTGWDCQSDLTWTSF